MTSILMKQLLDILTKYARDDVSIRGLGLMGSMGRGDYGPRSDLDLIILVDENASISGSIDRFIERTRLEIQEIVRPSNNKVLVFIGDNLQKLDVNFVHDIHEIEKYYRGSRINNVDNTILVDKDGSLLSAFREWTDTLEVKDIKLIISQTVESFLESFELASRYVYQSDAYRFYFNYNIALSYYASLVQIEKGNDMYLYTPRRLLDQMDIHKKNSMIKLVPSLIISEAFSKLEALGGEFCSVYQRLYSRYHGLKRKTEDIRKFITAILDRDMVWNFRDVSWIAPDIIRPGQLYRSSVLARFQNLKAFENFVKRHGIKRIIDLRKPHEIAEYPYTVTDTVEIVAISMEKRHDISCLGGYTGHLHSDLLDNPDVIKKCFSLLAEGVPTLIHCHTGKDRTGVIVALALLSVGIPEEQVKRDFMASGLDLKERDFELLLSRINSLGGVNETLKRLEVSDVTLTRVNDWIQVT